jgi:hypothetical protein
MATYGDYCIEYLKLVMMVNHKYFFKIKNLYDGHENSFLNLIKNRNQMTKNLDNISAILKFFGAESFNISKLFNYKLGLLSGQDAISCELLQTQYATKEKECRTLISVTNDVIAKFNAETKALFYSASQSCKMNKKAEVSYSVYGSKSSSVTLFTSSHDSFLKQSATIITAEEREKFKYFFEAINANSYSQALRTACTSTHPKAFELVKLLMLHAVDFKINIDEQAGDKHYSALHHAASKHNQLIYDYLLHLGAVQSLDIDGKTPEQLFMNQSQPRSKYAAKK